MRQAAHLLAIDEDPDMPTHPILLVYYPEAEPAEFLVHSFEQLVERCAGRIDLRRAPCVYERSWLGISTRIGGT